MLWSYSEDIQELTKPFRILISLMDKEEIGSALLDQIIMDIFKSLKQRRDVYGNYSELLQGADMLLDSINPFVIWRQVFGVVASSKETFQLIQSCEMISYILDIVRVEDEDARHVHMPILLFLLSTHFEAFKHERANFSTQSLASLVNVCSRMMSLIPKDAITHSWQLQDFSSKSPQKSRRLTTSSVEHFEILQSVLNMIVEDSNAGFVDVDQICLTLYSNAAKESNGASLNVGSTVVCLAFANFSAFLQWLLENIVPNLFLDNELISETYFWSMKDQILLTSLLESTVQMVVQLASRYLEMSEKFARLRAVNYSELFPTPIHWEWFESLGKCAAQTTNFSILNVCLSAVIQMLEQAKERSVVLHLDTEHFIQASVSQIWSFLDPVSFGIYHRRSVDLIWQLINIGDMGSYLVENIIANFLSARDLQDLVTHQHRFGILWRLSEKKQLETGITFSRPLFLVLDALRSQNPFIRRSGETWLKTYVASYQRVLEPLLATMLHPDINVIVKKVNIHNQERSVHFYRREFNMGQVLYSLETLGFLLSGSQPLLKDLAAVNILECGLFSDADFAWTQTELNTLPENLTYADALVYVCLRFIRNEIPTSGGQNVKFQKLQSVNISIQSQACEFLSRYLEFAGINLTLNSLIAQIVIEKASYSIATAQLDLQPRLLMVLSVLYKKQEDAVAAQNAVRRNSLSMTDTIDNLIFSGREALGLSPVSPKVEERVDLFETSNNFLSMVVSALSQTSNQNVLQNWIDFITLILPRIHAYFNSILHPIISVMCAEIQIRVKDIELYIQQCKLSYQKQESIGFPDSHIVALLDGLGAIMEYCLESTTSWSTFVPEKSKSATNLWDYNLTGIVTSVFVESSPHDPSEFEPQNSREAILAILPSLLDVLVPVFCLVEKDPFAVNDAVNTAKSVEVDIQAIASASLEFLCTAVQTSICKILQSVHLKHPTFLVTGVVAEWFVHANGNNCNKVIQMMHLVEDCTPKSVLLTIVDGLKLRFKLATNAGASRDKTDSHFLHFMEKYILFCVHPEVMNDVWPALHSYVFFIAFEQLKIADACLYFSLITVVIEKLILTKHFDDKRMRFHMDEIYQKLLDLTIISLSKPPEVQAMKVDPVASAAESPRSVRNGMTRLMPLPKPSNLAISWDILLHMSKTVFPNIRRLLLDQEKSLAVLANITYYVFAPNLKMSPNLSGAKLSASLEALHSISKLPFAVKTWKKEVWEAFIDPRFFDMNIDMFRMWKTVMNNLANADKELRMADLAAKISVSTSANLFVSREQEQVQRALFVRRISYLLWSGTTDQYLLQLPVIQEKLVEIVKGPAGALHLEAYLCLRILMCRMSAHHLANLWPIVLTELIQVFGVYLRGQEQSVEELQVFLACCKLLELLLLLGTEEFQWHQWIFVDETYGLADSGEESGQRHHATALVDKLKAKWASEAGTESNSSSGRNINSNNNESGGGRAQRRPMLAMRAVHDRMQLRPFVETLCTHTHAHAAAAPVDMGAVEELLEADLMDVRGSSSSNISSGDIAPGMPTAGVAGSGVGAGATRGA
ncbi:hypothetical protein HDU83_002865 [Entophlyctis luteolus]|nr:hypothetical protein HDU83_002865 [Entophlyctis luteolus]